MMSNNCSDFVMWYVHKQQLKFSSYASVIVMGLLSIPIASLNILILATIVSKRALHRPSIIFICNLAIADIAVAIIGIPISLSWQAVLTFSNDLYTVCALGYSSVVAGTMVSGASSLTLISAIVDRYFAVRFHLKYQSAVTNQRVVLVCILTWVISSTLALVIFLGTEVYDYLIVSLLLPCMSLLFFSYYEIFRIVHHHQNSIFVQSTQVNPHGSLPNMFVYKKTATALLYLMVLFFTFYVPFSVCCLYRQLKGQTMFFMKGWLLSIILIYVNSAVNPIVCYWKIRELRTAVNSNLSRFIGKDFSRNDQSVTVQ